MKSSMRTLLLSLALALSACTLRPSVPQAPESISMTPAESGDIIGENEEMPTTIESLETTLSGDISPYTTTLTESGAVLIGSPDAPRLTMVTDYVCSYCKAASEHLPWIVDTYVSSKRLAIEVIFLPQHADGVLSAKAAMCAGGYDKFSVAEKELFLSPLRTSADVQAFVKIIGVEKHFLDCVGDPFLDSSLAWHAAKAKELGVARVPGFSLNGHTWLGVATRQGLQAEIEKGLAR